MTGKMTLGELEKLLEHYVECVSTLPFGTVQAYSYMDKVMETINRIAELNAN